MRKLLLHASVIAVAIAGTAVAAPRFDTDQADVCFPANAWNANDNARPCAAITLYEDGSYNVKVKRADGKKWRAR